MALRFDPTEFWDDVDFAREHYISEPLTPGLLAKVERQLGYKLPSAYVELMQFQNGGMPRRTCHRTSRPTTLAHDHIAITGIFSIGDARPGSLCGGFGSKFMIDEWGYSAIGVYFADCPSAGHDMVCLDCRRCGLAGEPAVVHVDQEVDYQITELAPDFQAFVEGLEVEDAFDD